MLATDAEADREWVRNVGRENPEDAWILSDRDVWYPNPFYTGPAGPHPDDDSDYDSDGPDCDDSDDGYALASAGFGTDEDYGCFNSGDDY